MFRLIFAVVIAIALSAPTFAAEPQKADSKEKNLDIRSSLGDLHLGNDADARKAGFLLYPGARLKHDDENRNSVNLGILTEAFGMKVLVASYESDDAPGKIIDFYRDALKKYGKVVECHTREHGHTVDADMDDHENENHHKELKCEGDNTGPITELKVGTEENQHVVSVQSGDNGKGSTFALVYLHTRGKQGDI